MASEQPEETRKLILLLQGIVEFHDPSGPAGGSKFTPTAATDGAGSSSDADDEKAYSYFVKGHVQRSEVKVYAPAVFNWLHYFYGLSSSVYIQEWQRTLSGLVDGSIKAKKAPTGRSGALFLRSNSQTLIIKTIPQVECLALRRFLKDYVRYFLANPLSLLMKFFGLYRLLPSGVGSSPIYVVAINNFLWSEPAAPLTALYDLKARLHGPKIVDPRHAELNIPPGDVRRDDQLDRGFPMDEVTTEFLTRQMLSDIEWLRQHDCMDYSVLIGIRQQKGEQVLVRQPDFTSSSPSPSLTFVYSSMGGNELFYFGIIDILTEWGPKKIVAHNIKKQRTPVAALSTVEPNYYAERWAPFLRAIFPLDFVLLVSPPRPDD